MTYKRNSDQRGLRIPAITGIGALARQDGLLILINRAVKGDSAWNCYQVLVVSDMPLVDGQYLLHHRRIVRQQTGRRQSLHQLPP